jgi:hypothetical protein
MNKEFRTLGLYLKDAASLRLQMEPWLMDNKLQADGVRLYYAIDTDIIKLFTAPDEMSVPQEGGGGGYTQIFHDDTSSVCTALARALSYFLFYSLTPESEPLLVLPPHDDEVKRVYFSVARNVQQEHHRAYNQGETFKKLVSSYEKGVIDRDKLIQRLEQETPALIRFLYGAPGSSSAELRRFSRLLADRRIATPEHLLETGKVLSDINPQVLQPPVSKNEINEFAILRERWYERLQKSKSRRPILLIYEDASALARLEWINRELPPNQRMILISGDQSLINAAGEYQLEDVPASFAELYIRHPQAYLADARLLGQENRNLIEQNRLALPTSELVEWLQVFLVEAEFEPKDQYLKRLKDLVNKSEEELAKIANRICDQEPEAFMKLRQIWNQYNSKIDLCIGVTPPIMGIVREAAQEFLKKILDLDIPTLISQQVKETWEQFFEVAVEGGTGLLKSPGPPGFTGRGVPAIKFHSFPKAQAYVDRILGSKSMPEYLQSQKVTLRDLSQEEPFNYTYYIASGLLFASRGLWQICALLCRRALDIVDQKEGIPANITGREASYLLAVAIRHDSRLTSQLRQVDELLTQAYQRLATKKIAEKDFDVRFDSERLALLLTYHLYRIFLNQPVPDNLFSLADCQDQLIKLLYRMDEEEKDDRVKFNTERQILTNLFMVVLLRKFNEKEDININLLLPFIGRFKKNINPGNDLSIPIPRVTFLVKTVYLAIVILYRLWISIFNNANIYENIFHCLSKTYFIKIKLRF